MSKSKIRNSQNSPDKQPQSNIKNDIKQEKQSIQVYSDTQKINNDYLKHFCKQIKNSNQSDQIVIETNDYNRLCRFIFFSLSKDIKGDFQTQLNKNIEKIIPIYLKAFESYNITKEYQNESIAKKFIQRYEGENKKYPSFNFISLNSAPKKKIQEGQDLKLLQKVCRENRYSLILKDNAQNQSLLEIDNLKGNFILIYKNKQNQRHYAIINSVRNSEEDSIDNKTNTVRKLKSEGDRPANQFINSSDYQLTWFQTLVLIIIVLIILSQFFGIFDPVLTQYNREVGHYHLIENAYKVSNFLFGNHQRSSYDL